MAVSPADPTSPQGRFATALDAHLRAARRTGGKGRWTNESFAAAMAEAGQDITEATIRNWRLGKTIPQDRPVIDALLAALFGPPPAHAADRAALFTLWADATGYTAPTPPKLGGLPPPPARYHGRTEPHARIAAALLAGKPVAMLLNGTGGIGKTTLATAILHDEEIEHRFDDRRWFAALDTARDAEQVGIAIVRALGLDPATTRIDSVMRHMAEAPGLLALDNLETPWLADTEAMEALLARLARTPGLSLLATMRGATLASPDWQEEQVAPVDNATALAILNDYAPNIAADDPDWPEFRHALGGLPLAIALVGHRARTHHALAELWQDWQAQGTAIARRLGVEPGRLNSLDHSIALSLRHASKPALRLFALLGQLPSGIADEDRCALLATDALDARDDLLRLGLAHAPPGRLDLLPPIRRHAQASHPPQAPDGAAWPRHYLTLVAQEASRMRSDGAAAFARLTPELSNIESAFAVAPLIEALPAVNGFRYLAIFRGIGSAAPLLTLAQRCAEAGDAEGWALCLERAGHIAQACFDLDTARARYDQALPVYHRAGNVLGEANCTMSLGDIAWAHSDLDTARAHYDDAVTLYRSGGYVLGEANCIKRLGDIVLRRSDLDTAGACYDEARTLYRSVGDVLGEANCIHRLGTIALARSDFDTASAHYDKALPLYHRVGEVLGAANCIRSHGDIALERSDHDTARAHYDEALPLYRRISNFLGEANCILCLGNIARDQGDAPAARTRYEAALSLYRRIPDPFSIGRTHLHLANLPDAPDREAHLAAAREAWRSIGRTDLIDQHLPPPA